MNYQMRKIEEGNINRTNFFNKRRLSVLLLFFVITIGLITITLTQILKIDFSQSITFFKETISDQGIGKFLLFLVILLIFPFFRLFISVYYFHIVLKKLGIRIRKRDWFFVSWISFLIVFVSPSSLGSEPFWIYWLNKKVFNIKKVSALILVNSTLMQTSSLLITLPSFIFFCTQYEQLLINDKGIWVFWFAVVGIVIDVVVLAGLITIISCQKIHYLFSLFFHKIKKFLGMSYKTKEEMINEILVEKVFKKEAIAILKIYKATILGFIAYLIYNFFLFSCLYLAFGLLTDIDNLNFLTVYNYVNVGATANNFIPLPGSEGSLQIILKIMLTNGLNNNVVNKEVLINNSIFVWRFFTNWFPALIGFIVLIIKLSMKLANIRNKKINNNLKEKLGVLFIYDENSALMNGKSLEIYSNFFKENIDKKDIYILDYKGIFKLLNNEDLWNKRKEYLEKTKSFIPINKTLLQYLKFLYWKNKLLKVNAKMMKQYLLVKNFYSIIDFSFFGTKLLALHKEYYWIQNRSYDEIRGCLFKSAFINWCSSFCKKFILSFDPFYCINNVIVVNEKDSAIGINDKFIYINSFDEEQCHKYFKKITTGSV